MSSSKQKKLQQLQETNELNLLQQRSRQTLRQLHQQLQINTLQKQLNKKEFKPGTKQPKQKSKLRQIQPQTSLAIGFQTAQQIQKQNQTQTQIQTQEQSSEQQIKNELSLSLNNKVRNFVSKKSAPIILRQSVDRQREQTKNQSKKTPFNRTTFVKDHCENVRSLLIGDSYIAHIMNDPHPNIITLSYKGMNLKYLPKSEKDLNTILDNKKKKIAKLFYTVKQNQDLCSSYLIKTDTDTEVKKDLFRHFIDNTNLNSIGLWLGNAHFQYVFYHDLINNSFFSEMIDKNLIVSPQEFINQYKLFRDRFIEQAIENYASYIQLISKIFQHGKIFIIKLNHSPVVKPTDMYMALKKETINDKKNQNIEEKLTYIFDLLSFKERKLIVKKFNFGLRRKLRELNLINIGILSLDDIIYTEKLEYIKKDFKHKLERGEVNKIERHIVDNERSDIWKKITENLLNMQITYDLKRITDFPTNIKSTKSNNFNSISTKQQKQLSTRQSDLDFSSRSNNFNSVSANTSNSKSTSRRSNSNLASANTSNSKSTSRKSKSNSNLALANTSNSKIAPRRSNSNLAVANTNNSKFAPRRSNSNLTVANTNNSNYTLRGPSKSNYNFRRSNTLNSISRRSNDSNSRSSTNADTEWERNTALPPRKAKINSIYGKMSKK